MIKIQQLRQRVNKMDVLFISLIMLIIGGWLGYKIGKQPESTFFKKFMFMIEETHRDC